MSANRGLDAHSFVVGTASTRALFATLTVATVGFGCQDDDVKRCAEGYVLINDECLPCSEPCPAGQVEVAACTPAGDRVCADYSDTHFDDQWVDGAGNLITEQTLAYENYVINHVPWSEMGYVTRETSERDRCSSSCHDEDYADLTVQLEWFESRHLTGSSFYRELLNGCTQCHNGAGWAKWVDESNFAYPAYIPPDEDEFGLAANAGHPITCNVCHDQTAYPTPENTRLRFRGPVYLRSGGRVGASLPGAFFTTVTDAVIDLGQSDNTCASCHQGRVSGGAVMKMFDVACGECEASHIGVLGPPSVTPTVTNTICPDLDPGTSTYTDCGPGDVPGSDCWPCPSFIINGAERMFEAPVIAGVPPRKVANIRFTELDSHAGHVGASIYSFKGAEFALIKYQNGGSRTPSYSPGTLFHQEVGCLGCHGDHSFEPNAEQCVDCHGTDFGGDFRTAGHLLDYDGDGLAGRPYDELSNLIARLVDEIADPSNAQIPTPLLYDPERGFPYLFNNAFGGGPPVWYGQIVCFTSDEPLVDSFNNSTLDPNSAGDGLRDPCLQRGGGPGGSRNGFALDAGGNYVSDPNGGCATGQSCSSASRGGDGLCYDCIGETQNDVFTPGLAKAVFNLHFVNVEPGFYVHNLHYAVQLLRDSIEYVTGEPLGGVHPSGPNHRPAVDYGQLF